MVGIEGVPTDGRDKPITPRAWRHAIGKGLQTEPVAHHAETRGRRSDATKSTAARSPRWPVPGGLFVLAPRASARVVESTIEPLGAGRQRLQAVRADEDRRSRRVSPTRRRRPHSRKGPAVSLNQPAWSSRGKQPVAEPRSPVTE